MKVITKYILAVLILTFIMWGKVTAQIQIFAQVDSSKEIYAGENFIYYIIIDGENKPGEVDLSPLSKYNPQSAGNRDISQTSISIANGQTTQNTKKQYVMSYSITASLEGSMQLPAVTVTLDGKTYQTNPVNVNVIKPGTTDKLCLEVTLSEKQCYVGQPVIMTVKFYRYVNIGNYQFNIPVLSSDNFYVEESDEPGGQQAKESRLNYKGRDSFVLTFSRVLIPKHSGEIKIESSSVSADIAVGQTRSRDPSFDDFDFFGSRTKYSRFMVSSDPLILTVLPLPEEGKPAEFYGLVGRFSISASATPTNVSVGDPITLTIKIGGGKYLKPIQWPALEEVQELASNFKIPSQKAAPTIENDFKVFTQTIRANNDKVTSIPSIPLAFFDIDKGKYAVVKTVPIPLSVAPTKILTNADVESRDFTAVNKEVEATKKGLSANYEDFDVLKNQTFSPLAALVAPGYGALWAVPLVTLILSLLFKLLMHTTPEKTALKRRRSASAKAIRQLKKIASVSPQRSQSLTLAVILKQYIGERFDKIAGSLTADDCYEIIVSATEDMESAAKYKNLINGCETARYAAAEVHFEPLQIKEMIKLIGIIEKKSRK